MATFGTLERVAIRDGWPREDTDFSQWLVEPANLAALGTQVGFHLELLETEVYVGTYRADILAMRSGTDEMVVIENQFGRTDHDHLGKLMTYAAGVGSDGTGARTMIWIAEKFTDPHRAALDWLNKCTVPEIRFFGAELELWRIGDSPYAPKFNLVSKPNDWQKQLTQQASAASSLYELYRDFWTSFIEFCADSSPFEPSMAPAQHWLAVYAIRTGIGINLTVSKRDGAMTTQLWMESRDSKPIFDRLSSRKDEISAALGVEAEFDRKDGKNSCCIFESHPCDITNRAEWPAMHSWLKERGEAYVRVFKPLVKTLT